MVAVSVTAWTGQAAAAKPEWAGPPMVETFDLVDDPVSFQCGERHLTFTGGQLVIRSRTLPDGSVRDTRRPVDGTLVDQFGTIYRVHGSAGSKFDPATGSGTFRITGALVGPPGTTGTINSRFHFEGAEMTPTERGTCTVVFG